MKAKLIVASLLGLFSISAAQAQCNGQGVAGSVCASPAMTQGLPSFQQAPTLGAVGGSSGQLTLKGSTSGSATIGSDATGQLLLGNNVGNKSTIFNDGATNGTSLTISGASGVIANTFTINPATAANSPSIQTTGSDTNIDLTLKPKGTGSVAIPGSTGSATLKLSGSSSGSASISVPAAAGTPTTLQLPTTNGSANNFLQTNGSGVLSWAQPVVTVKKQIFTGSGTYTPSTGMLFAIIECVGSGGGGGGAAGAAANFNGGGGGGGGGYSRLLATAGTIGGSQTVTIGTAGTAGSAGANNGGNGGDTSVGTLCVGKGGSGGTGVNGVNNAGNGGAGGVAGTGDFTVPGEAGGTAAFGSITTVNISTNWGGNSGLGFGAGGKQVTPGPAAGVTGTTGSNYGGGGAGAVYLNVASNFAGGGGQLGIVAITEFNSQ